MNVLRWRHGLVPIGLGACLALAGIGTALAEGGLLQAPKGLVPADGTPFVPQKAPTYPVNTDGLTYGSALDAISPDTEPDLILVEATNGKEGYVKKTQLDLANGSAENFNSPAAALAWQAAHRGLTSTLVVYASDGRTPIGLFIVAGNG